MEMIRLPSIIFLAILAMAGFTSSIPTEVEDSSDIKTVAQGNTIFALDLYNKLKETEGNLFFSPYSISTALAMTYAGARGNTEKQMAEVLHFTLDQKKLHPAFARLEAQLNSMQDNRNIELTVANALWTQKDYVFLREFLDLTKNNYGAALNLVDFKKAHEAVRIKINAWVEEKTRNKIKDLIKPGVLDPLVRLVLTNAIYFKGNWESQFEKSKTKEAPFWLAPGKSVKVPMMTRKQKFNYMENDRLQILELPYVGNDLSMIVVLPKKIEGVAQLERVLSVDSLNAWLGLLRKREILVYLPKFKTSSQFSLGEMLSSMGMSDAFTAHADFSGMTGNQDLYISVVIHKAFVDVNEEGTEAAAATAVAMKLLSMPAPPPVFRADHSFIFLIRHNPSGSILFLGRITNPLK
jgi:serine protease inhibitor